ncbi:biotin--[acetyl-CoA-carboxylase] ligase [Fodinibius salsisoli]|uniref:Biotin--[acetyl-CoA-carboxylase] ligase n=1 Tax=Fodinibius salsisoli TaxID=2820877 RepID=A0ABT3PRR1_9BACT|nr:biotin--[acetyl-CoA-carboxylase] ligase [Fodinibius salsisoli]MCW9708526.1 biotin--[acetyl-CoA-carboxylase] ligase [Fodinibius salsisoli]
MSTTFDLSDFESHLSTQWLGRDFRYFRSLPSTNTHIKKLDADDVEPGMVVLTDNQTGGRGQYDRNWISEAGQNLTFSMVFKPQTSDGFHTLTLACALALVEQVESISEEPCTKIKWPNDVLVNGKKVAGLLTEAVFIGNRPARLVIGIGLNVNQQEYAAQLSEKATSLQIEMEKQIAREELLSNLLARIEHKYRLWHQNQAKLLIHINRKIDGYGQWVGLKVNGAMKQDSYKLLGINETGRLLLLNHEGGIESFSHEQIRIVTD